MFDIILTIFLLLSPIIILPAIGDITALQFYQFGVIDSTNFNLQLQFFQLGVIVLFIISMFKKKARELEDKWLALFLFVSLVSVILHPKSVLVFGNIFLGFLLYKLTFEHARHIRLLLFAVVIVSIFNFIAQMSQLLGVRFIYQYAGLMKNPSHLGTYYALSIPIFYIFSPVLTIIPIVGLLLTKTWTAVFSVVFTIGYVFRKKIIDRLDIVLIMLLMSILAIFIILFYRPMLRDLYPRLLIWKETLKSLTFLGHGFGDFNMSKPGQFDKATNTYNVYLGLLYSLGIFSIPIFIWLHRILKIRNKLFPSILILVIIGSGQSIMDFPRLAGTAIVLFSLLKLKGGNV